MTDARKERLFRLLHKLATNEEVLPKCAVLAERIGGYEDAYSVNVALASLANAGRISWRHGTRSNHRGEMAIRIGATTIRTQGCPQEWEP